MIKATEVCGIGNALDRYSILKMKVFRIHNSNCEGELKMIEQFIRENYEDADTVLSAVDLAIGNANTWHLESDMRAGKFENDMKKVGEASVKIRSSNKERQDAIAKFNKITKTGFIDVKVNHLSGEVKE